MHTAAVRKLRKHLRTIEQELKCQLKSQARRCGVSSAQCHVLLELAKAGKTTLIELAKHLRLDTSTLSRTVDGLVRAGQVTRITNPADRRCVQISLTTEGKRKKEVIDQGCDQFYLKILKYFPGSKQGRLAESMRRLGDIFENERKSRRLSRNGTIPGQNRIKHRKPRQTG